MVRKKECVAMLLAGGRGSRLYVLTTKVAKPAVPFGGKYRIIDFPLSNCVNSGIDTVGVLTQYEPHELNVYLANGQTWDLDRLNGGVSVLSPYENGSGSEWYKGTANAIYQNIGFIDEYDPEYVLILSGDHIYKMDYDKMLDQHKEKNAAATIAVLNVTLEEAKRFGIMNCNPDGSIYEFEEKPAHPKSTLASMGIYIFDADTMEEMLNNDYNDFGKEIIPMAIKSKKVSSYIFNGYWEDIGTIRSFYEATLDLTNPIPQFNFYDEDKPIYTHMRNLPPSKINHAEMVSTLASEGCVITNSRIQHSVIGVRSVINEGCDLEGVIMMGADFYETEAAKKDNKEKGVPNLGIGKNCKINKAIIDKNAHIGENCCINVSGRKYEDGDHGLFYSADGIIVIRKGAVIPNGTVI